MNNELVLNTIRNALKLFEYAATETRTFLEYYENYPEFPTEEQRLKLELLFNNMMLATAHIESLMRQNAIKDEMMTNN